MSPHEILHAQKAFRGRLENADFKFHQNEIFHAQTQLALISIRFAKMPKFA